MTILILSKILVKKLVADSVSGSTLLNFKVPAIGDRKICWVSGEKSKTHSLLRNESEHPHLDSLYVSYHDPAACTQMSASVLSINRSS